MYTLCIVLVLIASALMVLAVLVQNPKSGMASNFGASNQIVGVRQTADFLEKATWGLAVAIFALSLLATLAMDTKPAQSPVAAEASALVEDLTAPVEGEVVVPQAEVPAEVPAEETAPAEVTE